ncbi:exostosin family protein [Dictyocaulus viviparus]|uniref:Exostosin family protein n=1 Tax=Dictyocaulus viviparus TaxID=29172 RepID=A0A0D8XIF0_DICVI|nr:exostosin family protein [Dictyocaulus viviparus]
MKTPARYAFLCISMLSFIWFLCNNSHEKANSRLSLPAFSKSYTLTRIPAIQWQEECTMHSCFNYEKCRSVLKVFVYPDIDGLVPSEAYMKILSAIRESRYFVSDPNEACLYVVSVDTIDRDKISENYVRNVDWYISNLPIHIWNEGANHIIFNLYHGTFPDYTDHNLGFKTQKAIIARASPNVQNYRVGFDISFPLFHKDHPLRSSFEHSISFRTKDQYIVSFKGKRYVYGIGSETRDSLHHLHNGETIAMVTTCRHNNDWKAHQDARCKSDNDAYDRWDYESMMANSTFCLTPRGRRLGSFRFLESLRLGCIPVVLSDDWVLPFDEIIDWSTAVVVIPEHDVPDILYTYTEEDIFDMKQHGFYIYHRYFSSVEKITITALEVVWERIRISEAEERFRWNHLHPFDTSAAIEVTVVIKSTEKPSSRLQKAVSILSDMKHLQRIIVLWPYSRGVPPVGADFGKKVSLEFIKSKDEIIDVDLLRDVCRSGFIVFVDERLNPDLREVVNLLEYSYRNPTRLIGVHGIEYDWRKQQFIMGRLYNAVFFSLVSFHSWYLSENVSPIPSVLWKKCLPAVINVVITEQSMSPPMVVGVRGHETWMRFNSDVICYRELGERWQTGPPLIYSDFQFI